jgi:hypothetical protein
MRSEMRSGSLCDVYLESTFKSADVAGGFLARFTHCYSLSRRKNGVADNDGQHSSSLAAWKLI